MARNIERSDTYPRFCPTCPIAGQFINIISSKPGFKEDPQAELKLTCTKRKWLIIFQRMRMEAFYQTQGRYFEVDIGDVTPGCDGLKEEKRRNPRT